MRRPSSWATSARRLLGCTAASREEADPGDHLFPEPKVPPEIVAAGAPPKATLRATAPSERLPVLIQARYPRLVLLLLVAALHREDGQTVIIAPALTPSERLGLEPCHGLRVLPILGLVVLHNGPRARTPHAARK